jgi:ABC-2 type transport system permease protein
LNWTPFPYLLFFPVSIYLGQINEEAIWRGLCIQGAWVLIFFLIAQAIWKRGIRKYAAFGG